MFRRGRFEIVDIQNATLAGGVAVGAVAAMRVSLWGSMLLGLVAGLLSTGGFALLQPQLAKRVALYDTCGIHNLHGMPGLLGGFASVLVAGVAQDSDCE